MEMLSVGTLVPHRIPGLPAREVHPTPTVLLVRPARAATQMGLLDLARPDLARAGRPAQGVAPLAQAGRLAREVARLAQVVTHLAQEGRLAQVVALPAQEDRLAQGVVLLAQVDRLAQGVDRLAREVLLAQQVDRLAQEAPPAQGKHIQEALPVHQARPALAVQALEGPAKSETRTLDRTPI